jgi:hypothetical protein
MTGADCTLSILDLYDVAGSIRATLIELQKQVRMGAGANRVE